ncbi:hypothetical protein [Saccharospirillum alexandrii]|uniref:hypothetical protein n=1 Tax=Saccharospirillum alexandrii TaxID=2448477 RepID=UPI000FD887E3|nr:hypothetical protein [Saccharospirillum alexandrii]
MKPTLWALIGALAMPLGASAFDMRLNGFMSIAGGMTLGDDQTLVIDPVNLAAYDNDLNFATDSLVAIQAIAEVNDRMTATAQMVGRGGEDFNTQFEWAYLTYEATDSLDVKGGRLRMPLFYYSNFLELGYGYQWVRPPVETYNIFVTTLEGISADYNFYIGDFSAKASGYAGSTQGTDPESGSEVDFNTLAGGSLDLAINNLSFRGSYNTADNATLTRGASPAFEFPITFISGAAMYDNGTLFTIAEYTSTLNDTNLINNRYNSYVSLGYRVGTLTPHATLARYEEETNSIDPGYNQNPREYQSATLGMRWDFDIAAALKVEYTRREDTNPDSLRAVGDADLLSFAIDVVF